MSNGETTIHCTDCGHRTLEKNIYICGSRGKNYASNEYGKQLCDDHCLVKGSMMYHGEFCQECYDKRFS